MSPITRNTTVALVGCLVLVPFVGRAVAATGGTAPAGTTATASPCGRVSTAPAYKHVVWILEENHSYGSIIGSTSAPYVNLLARECGLATNYHNISHPSLPNYVGMTDGATVRALSPFYNDCSPPSALCDSSSNNLFHQNSSWKAYDESMSSKCDKLGTSIYADRHNPALYYTDLTNCSTHDVPLGTTSNSQLLKDFSSQTSAPRFAFVTPNLCHDMHGSLGVCSPSVPAGDSWLKTWVSRLTATKVYASGNTAIFIVWDEGSNGVRGESCYANTADQSCHVAMITVAPSVKPGTRVGTLLNHFSLLKTTENLLGYPALGLASSAASFKTAFRL